MIISQNGTDTVIALSGGVSCFDYTPPLGKGRIWRLAAGTAYPDSLFLRDDHNGHLTWEPAVDMPLANFKGLLVAVGQEFA